jgi:dynein assembly factor 5
MSASTLAREINILTEPTSDRSSKKGALDKILNYSKKLSQEELTIQAPQLMKPLLRSVVDPIEKCREISMDAISL